MSRILSTFKMSLIWMLTSSVYLIKYLCNIITLPIIYCCNSLLGKFTEPKTIFEKGKLLFNNCVTNSQILRKPQNSYANLATTICEIVCWINLQSLRKNHNHAQLVFIWKFSFDRFCYSIRWFCWFTMIFRLWRFLKRPNNTKSTISIIYPSFNDLYQRFNNNKTNNLQ